MLFWGSGGFPITSPSKNCAFPSPSMALERSSAGRLLSSDYLLWFMPNSPAVFALGPKGFWGLTKFRAAVALPCSELTLSWELAVALPAPAYLPREMQRGVEARNALRCATMQINWLLHPCLDIVTCLKMSVTLGMKGAVVTSSQR